MRVKMQAILSLNAGVWAKTGGRAVFTIAVWPSCPASLEFGVVAQRDPGHLLTWESGVESITRSSSLPQWQCCAQGARIILIFLFNLFNLDCSQPLTAKRSNMKSKKKTRRLYISDSGLLRLSWQLLTESERSAGLGVSLIKYSQHNCISKNFDRQPLLLPSVYCFLEVIEAFMDSHLFSKETAHNLFRELLIFWYTNVALPDKDVIFSYRKWNCSLELRRSA